MNDLSSVKFFGSGASCMALTLCGDECNPFLSMVCPRYSTDERAKAYCSFCSVSPASSSH